MKKPYYSKINTYDEQILAEQNEDGTWTIDTSSGSTSIADDAFQTMFTPRPPKELKHWASRETFNINIHKVIDEGTHTVDLISTKEELMEFGQTYPEAHFIQASTGSVIRFDEFPLGWVGWVEPGEDICKPEHAHYGLPLIALREN